jgi:hypothetical protein
MNCHTLVSNPQHPNELWGSPILFTYLLHGAESFYEKLTGSATSQEIPRILEPEGSSPYSQVPATCP